jgi:hypothetical protein
MSETCPVCGSKVSNAKDVSLNVLGLHGYYYSCPMCGDYQIESFIAARVEHLRLDPEKMAVLSHWIRTKHESIRRGESKSESIVLTPDLVDNILRQSPPSCAEQANKFILWLGNSKNPPGEPVIVEPEKHQSIMGAMTPMGFSLVVDELVHEDLLKNVTAPLGNKWTITLSYKGWQQYDKLKRGAVDSRKAFMAMQYNDARLDGIVDNVFKPAVEKTGFILRRLVDMPQPAGLIDNRLRVEIRTSHFLIADLTHGNKGAYWEAGYAEGLGKPVIYTCEKKEFEELKTHFDTNHHLTIRWGDEDADKLKLAAEELKATIRATLPAEAKLTDD